MGPLSSHNLPGAAESPWQLIADTRHRPAIARERREAADGAGIVHPGGLSSEHWGCGTTAGRCDAGGVAARADLVVVVDVLEQEEAVAGRLVDLLNTMSERRWMPRLGGRGNPLNVLQAVVLAVSPMASNVVSETILKVASGILSTGEFGR